MCDNHTPAIHKAAQQHLKKRQGATLEHLAEHEREHRNWSRRDFVQMTGLASLGAALSLGASKVATFAPNALLHGLNTAECGDRVLVLIRLKGGNDGLNMVIPRGNDEYYNIRPNIAIQESGLWGLSPEVGMPNEMVALQNLWEAGHMRVIHNVGYPDANYSHFRSSDIWASASGSDEIVGTGWIGRWLDNEYMAFNSAPPTIPPALEIGVQTNMIFRATGGSMALAIINPQAFYQLAQTGELYDTSQFGNDPNEQELSFVRGVANSAFRYAETIRTAYNGGINEANYANNGLAERLSIVARLIKGRLGSKIYMVTIDGFDTHAEQLNSHPTLLNRIAESVNAFFQDLGEQGQNVLAMTFSEFGRTIFENGSLGTDHGTGSPMLVFGSGLEGNGFHGALPDLVNVDQYGDPVYSVDFRTAYATVLQNWLCVHPDIVDNVLGQPFNRIETLLPPSSPSSGNEIRATLLGHNPDLTQAGRIQIKYAVKVRGAVRIQILNTAGQPLRTLVNEFHERGSYTFGFSPAQFFLSPGEYIYRLEAGGKASSKVIKVF